jgi:hypothetical protein
MDAAPLSRNFIPDVGATVNHYHVLDRLGVADGLVVG